MSVIVAIAQINSTVGDLAGNSERIAAAARRAADQGVDILLTPELSLVGYPPEDLLLRRSFYAKSAAALAALAAELAALKGLHVIVGHPLTEAEGDGNGAGDFVNYNAASVLKEGEIIATYRKHALPNYTVFDEKRYFTPSDDACTFDVKGTRFAINICEDTWYAEMPRKARESGAQVLLVPNASPYHMNKQHLRVETLRENVSSRGMALVDVAAAAFRINTGGDVNAPAHLQPAQPLAPHPHHAEQLPVELDGLQVQRCVVTGRVKLTAHAQPVPPVQPGRACGRGLATVNDACRF